MKNKSPRLLIAGWLLVAAFAANAWLQYIRWENAFDSNYVYFALANFGGQSWFSDLIYYPSAILFSPASLLLAVYALVTGRAWPIITGSILTMSVFPIVFISDLLSMVAIGFENPFLATIKIYLNPHPPLILNYLSLALAMASLVFTFGTRANPYSASHTKIPSKPVGFDTQTGRPISGYDTQTGEPIYVDGPIDKKTD